MEPPPTPVPLPSQMRGWAQGYGSQSGIGGPASSQPDVGASTLLPRGARTPSRPRVGLQHRESPRRAREASTLRRAADAPTPARHGDDSLLGFQNAFAPFSGRRAEKRGRNVGAQAQPPLPPVADAWAPEYEARTPRRTPGEPPSPPSSPTPGLATVQRFTNGKGRAPYIVDDDEDVRDARMASPPPELPEMEFDLPPLVPHVELEAHRDGDEAMEGQSVIWKNEVGPKVQRAYVRI
jgi:hypothetical protein